MKSNIDKAIETIRGYCSKHKDCSNCKMADESDFCTFNSVLPLNWQTESERRTKS